MNDIENNKKNENKEALTIREYLKKQDIVNEKIAIAVNYEIIPIKLWDEYCLKSNDNIEIIRPTQGG